MTDSIARTEASMPWLRTSLESRGISVRERIIVMVMLVLSLAMAVAAYAYLYQQQQNTQEVLARFEKLRARVLGEVVIRMRQYEYGLRGTRGAVAAMGDGLNSVAFARYGASRDMDLEFPGARGFGFIRRVSPDERDAFSMRAAQEYGQPLAIGVGDGRESQDAYVVQYIEPLDRNRLVLGMDIASDPVRREAAEEAMRHGRATLSAPIELLQDGQAGSKGLMLILPVFRQGEPTYTTQARVQGLVGWVYAPLQMSEVLKDIDSERDLFTMRIRDRDAPYDMWLFDGDRPLAPSLQPRVPMAQLDMFGRWWMADLQPTPAFVESLALLSPEKIAAEFGAFALAFSSLVMLGYIVLQRDRGRVLEQARRAAIVDGSDDAIIVQTLAGMITDWNDGAHRLFGYTAQEALGHTAQELLVPDGRRLEDESMLARVSRGERVKAYETVRLHRDGSVIEVSISAGPIVDMDGRVVGLAKTLRDVREARAAARQVAELNATLEDQVRERTADLETARAALQTVLDAMPSQIGYWDTEKINRVANRACALAYGLTPAQVHGQAMRELVGEAAYASMCTHVDAALRGEVRMFEQTHHAGGDGMSVHVLVHCLPDVREGRVRGLYTFIHDVTELTESRLQLAAAQRDTAALLATLQRYAIVSVADRAGRIVDVNDAFCQISGYTREELLGQNHRIVNSGAHDANFWLAMWQTISAGQSWRAEVCNRSRSGELYWVDSVIAPFFAADGRVEKYVSIRTDITARKRAEIELQRTFALLQSVLEASTQVAIVATDAQGVVSLLNKGTEVLLGVPASSMVGLQSALTLFDVEPPNAFPGHSLSGHSCAMGAITDEALMGRFFHATHESSAQWFMLKADGDRVPVALAVTRMEDTNGEISGYLAIASDIRLRLEQEQSLRVAMEQANEANAAKSRFLANMSHEIRTPMNAVIGLSHMLARTVLDAEQNGMLQRLQVAGKALLCVINDVLDLSKIEAGEMALEQVPIDVNEVVRDVGALIELNAREKGLRYVLDVQAAVPSPLEGDSTRLHQVLINLLSNAVKFTHEGEVRLTVRHSPLEHGHCVDFSVSDTGIGIDASALERLFSPFMQADLSTTRRYGGTGLGLSIVKQLVEMMKGTIHVSSTVGKGSCFHVALPMRISEDFLPAKDADLLLSPGQGLRELRLLVVDDNDTNREVAQRILESEGAQVALASNGQQALDILVTNPKWHHAVLMDVQMPVMNGLEATRRMRAHEALQDLPVIGLTAGVSLAEHRQALDAGMTIVVGKPFEPADLVRSILRCTRRGAYGPVIEERVAEAAQESNPELNGWPQLPAIDPWVSQRRLGGNPSLFWQLLRRLVMEVQALAQQGEAAALDGKSAYQRLHDIQGMAGTIGAQSLYAAAQSAHALLGAENGQALRERISFMHSMVQAWPAEPTTGLSQEAIAQSMGEATISSDQLQQWREALVAHDLAALDRWNALRPALVATMTPFEMTTLQQCMDALAFEQALPLLDALMARVAVGGATPRTGSAP